MSQPRLIQIRSLDQLRAGESAWDDLWWRSDLTKPTYRAALLAQWIAQFAPGEEFRGLVVEHGGRWAAALPLVSRRLGRVLRAGGTPSNEWGLSGELLLDPAADVRPVLHTLASSLAELPWQLFWLDVIRIDAPRWQRFRRSACRAGMAVARHEHVRVGFLPLGGDWKTYRSGWSRKHRQQLARAGRRLARQGRVQLRVHRDLAPEDVEPWMRRGFEIEDRSWKGQAGTSVLRTPGMFAFFVRQAVQLAEWGQLELAFLELDGRPVAFSYGMNAKGIYHAYKSGFDSKYAGFSPGNLLRYRMLERFYALAEYRAVDFMGPLNASTRRWKPQSYLVGRQVLAPGRWLGRTALHLYRAWWPRIARLRRGNDSCRPNGGRRADTRPATTGLRPRQPAGPQSS